MMSRYILAADAERDLEEIWDYIAVQSVEAADAVANDFRMAFEKLAEHPGIGHRRDDVRNQRYRFWRVHRFIIAYFPATDSVQIVRVVGGQRDFRRLFRKA